MRAKKIYYYVELSAEMVDMLQPQIDNIAKIRCGDLSVLANIIESMYKDRVGEDMTSEMQELVKKHIEELMLLGWGRNIDDKINPKNYDPIADALFDTAKVLGVQRDYDEGPSKDLSMPEVWSKNIALPRFRRRNVTTSNRDKQLRVFKK